jgi:YD repeat-containing protein
VPFHSVINRRTAYSGDAAPEPQETATNTATVDASNRYTSLNGKPVSHDENGNQTINNAVWDARDRLVSLSGPGYTASFSYDAMGKRSSKTVDRRKPIKKHYLSCFLRSLSTVLVPSAKARSVHSGIIWAMGTLGNVGLLSEMTYCPT